MGKPILFVGSAAVVIVAISLSAYFYFHGFPASNIVENTPSVGEQGIVQTPNETTDVTQEITSSSETGKSGPLVIREIQQEYEADFSNDGILVGGSHNIFVAKIIKKVGNESRLSAPKTQFEAEIIYNIKGSLSGKVIVSQTGGYLNGILYVVGGINFGDVVGPTNESEAKYLLQPGYTYLLATRHIKPDDFYTMLSFPGVADNLISDNQGLSSIQLRALAENDSRVRVLQMAYPKEILLSSDIRNSTTINSYKSLTEAQKYALPYYAGSYSPPPTSTTSTATSTR